MKAKFLTIIFILSLSFFSANESRACPPPNQNPVAILTVSPGYAEDVDTAYVIVDKTVTFDGSASYDPDGSIVKYEWDFDGDSTYDYYETASYYPDGAFDGVTTYVYDDVTTTPYEVELTVRDNEGAHHHDTVDVDVSDDTDSDDLADEWEQYYWPSDPLSSHNPDVDEDGDDYSNLIEYLCGTDPKEGTKYPSPGITIVVPEEASFIQRAIDSSQSSNIVTVVVSEGRYYENIDFDGKAITVRSTEPDNWDVVAKTIICPSDPQNPGNVVTFNSSEGEDSVLRGFTITGGERGIYCEDASPTIKNCVVIDNRSEQ